MYKSIAIAGMMIAATAMSAPAKTIADPGTDRSSKALSASAIDMSGEERSAIRVVVQSYLWALANQQSKLLFLTASNSVTSAYASPEALLAKMTRVHRPIVAGSLERFDGLKSDGDKPIQGVYIKDEHGRQWLASYLLEKDTSGFWKIAGCIIVPAPGKVV